MRNRLTILTICAAMSVGVAAGQGFGRGFGAGPRAEGGTPPSPEQMQEARIERLGALLDLTEAQKAQAKTIFTGAAQQSVALRESMQAAETALREAIQANNPAGIDIHAAEVGRLTGQTRAVHAKAHAQFLTILAAEQREKLGKLGVGLGLGPGMGRGMGPGMGPGAMGQRPMGPRIMRRATPQL
jgi:Spy/CpxP family protein refolding chaperone